MIDTSQIVGYGVDADPSRRPGIPKEIRGVKPLAPRELTQQRSGAEHFVKERPHASLTPVFGTGQPPKGAAGALRRLAYQFPVNWTRHWMLLLVADRVDVWEHRLRGARGLATLAALGVAGGLAVGVLRARRRAPAEI